MWIFLRYIPPFTNHEKQLKKQKTMYNILMAGMANAVRANKVLELAINCHLKRTGKILCVRIDQYLIELADDFCIYIYIYIGVQQFRDGMGLRMFNGISPCFFGFL